MWRGVSAAACATCNMHGQICTQPLLNLGWLCFDWQYAPASTLPSPSLWLRQQESCVAALGRFGSMALTKLRRAISCPADSATNKGNCAVLGFSSFSFGGARGGCLWDLSDREGVVVVFVDRERSAHF